MSAFSYLLIAEVFGNQIRPNEKIIGAKVNGTEIKILQYADGKWKNRRTGQIIFWDVNGKHKSEGPRNMGGKRKL